MSILMLTRHCDELCDYKANPILFLKNPFSFWNGWHLHHFVAAVPPIRTHSIMCWGSKSKAKFVLLKKLENDTCKCAYTSDGSWAPASVPGDLTPLFSAYKTIDCVGIWKPICPRTSLFSSLLRVCLHFWYVMNCWRSHHLMLSKTEQQILAKAFSRVPLLSYWGD